METSLLTTQSHHHTQKRLFKKTTILAFYSLTGCATWKSTSSKQSVTQDGTSSVGNDGSTNGNESGQSLENFSGATQFQWNWHRERHQIQANGQLSRGGGWGNRRFRYDSANQNAYQDGRGECDTRGAQRQLGPYRCWSGTSSIYFCSHKY